jgi:hypothetical protein
MRILQTGLIQHDTAGSTPGFTLFAPLWQKKTFILDMDGKVVHEWDLPSVPGGYARLLPNGNLFVSTKTDEGPPFPGGAQGGLMQELDWNGNVLNEFVDHFQHHDCRRLPNGHTIYAAWEKMPSDAAARVTGGAPGSESPDGLYCDVIREADAAGNLVFEWRCTDLEIENYPLNPLIPRRVFAWCNATFPLPNGDILLSFRNVSTIAIVDRRRGVIRWEKTDFSWGGQHDPQMLPNGNIILFANGYATYDAHPFSRVVEFDPDTGESVWTYRSTPGWHFYSHHISGQERLWSGNTLICEGLWGRLFEVTPEGEIVWEYISPYEGATFQGEPANWVFRCFRYAEDSPEIAGRLSL